MKDLILASISAACPWRDTLHWYDTIDSTNTRAKELAKQGAPHGTVLVAAAQTAGRGRLGRDFQSDRNMGVYLSAILRPECPAEELMHLTCAVAVATCDAVQKVCGIRPDVKWINDLVWQKKKLGGILTELAIDSKTGNVDYAVVGIGINCRQTIEDFPPHLQQIACSLLTATGHSADTAALAAALTEALWEMSGQLRSRAHWMACYRRDCITLGQEVAVHRGEDTFYGTALSVDDAGALVVRCSDGSERTVNSGEVSVRGLYGYV